MDSLLTSATPFTVIFLRHLFLCLGSLSCLGPALAGRPLQTEDAGVLEPRACELEGASLHLRDQSARSREMGLALGCGIGWRSQLSIGIARMQEDGERTRIAQLGGKTWLWQGSGDQAPAIAVAWALGALRKDHHDDWHHASADVNLVASLPVGTNTVHLNLGHARDVPSRLVATTWGAAIEHPGVDLAGVNWAPMAEIFGDDRESPWWNLALRATVIPDRLYFDVSYGRAVRPDAPRLITAGFKIAF
ncbi:MAG: hypothetical protein EOP40_07745 [Rubrivivax sp.]|nr:MAG: hypothetical protein EOP40_07745 [Rubrivivax sp.]